MALHLIKLCVGVESIRDLDKRIAARLKAKRQAGEKAEALHRTRMTPKRQEELLDGGSLYWVIKGQVSARQEIRNIRPVTDEQGIKRCFIVLARKVIPVTPRPMRPFQGWRYLREADAPADLGNRQSQTQNMPEEMRRELSRLGLV